MRDGMAAALKDPSHEFTRADVAELMATAYRWGYEHRVDQENGLADEDDEDLTLIFDAENIPLEERITYRRLSDLLAARPWIKDYQGRRAG